MRSPAYKFSQKNALLGDVTSAKTLHLPSLTFAPPQHTRTYEDIPQSKTPTKPLSMENENFLKSYLEEAQSTGFAASSPSSAYLLLSTPVLIAGAGSQDSHHTLYPIYPEVKVTFKHRPWALSGLGWGPE